MDNRGCCLIKNGTHSAIILLSGIMRKCQGTEAKPLQWKAWRGLDGLMRISLGRRRIQKSAGLIEFIKPALCFTETKCPATNVWGIYGCILELRNTGRGWTLGALLDAEFDAVTFTQAAETIGNNG